MLKNTKTGMATLVAAPFIGLMASSSAMAETRVCNANTARTAANNADYSTLCGCAQITPSFITHLQNRSDFGSILTGTSQQCPGLANLLSDVPTASISNATNFEGREDDSDDFQPSSNSEPGGRDGASGSSDRSDSLGGGGGNDDPGNGSGDDDPGDSNDDPVGGGGKPGHGGDKPGKGGGNPGHGDGKPGKGGGHGDGKGGSGKGGGGKGDGKGGGGKSR